jgi:hypothetical protein
VPGAPFASVYGEFACALRAIRVGHVWTCISLFLFVLSRQKSTEVTR